MSSQEEKRSKEPCVRCGDIVSVLAAVEEKVYCVNCRPKPSARPKPGTTDSAKEASPTESPVKLSIEDILTVTCRLCRSSLLVNESKVGTKIRCPDCHSEVVVERSKSRAKKKTGRPQPKTNQPSFDPNAELSLEETFERPKIEPSALLDDATEDLLSAPLPQADPLSIPADESNEAGEGEGLPDDDQPLTRRQRYEEIQQQAISEGRDKKRARARAKKAAKNSGSERTESAAVSNEANSRRKKRRRRRKGQRGSESQSPSWLKPAFGWLRRRSLIAGWVLSAACLSVVYFAGADWSPFVLLDRVYGMLTRAPLVVDVWLIVNAVLLIVGSLCLCFSCGRSFAMNAKLDREFEAGGTDQQPDASSVFTTLHFGLAWWLAGLPFLYFSILLLPAQFLIVAPLLVGSWLNRSVWKFVRADGLIHPARQKEGRRLWRKFYSLQLVVAAIAIPPVLMIRAGGVPTIIGCVLAVGIMIGMAGICGRHCRELSKSLEPSA